MRIQVGGGRKGLESEGFRENRITRQGTDWVLERLAQLGRGGTNSWDGFSRTQFSFGVDSMPCLRHPGGAQEAGMSIYAQERDVSQKSESGDEPGSLQSISTHLLF